MSLYTPSFVEEQKKTSYIICLSLTCFSYHHFFCFRLDVYMASHLDFTLNFGMYTTHPPPPSPFFCVSLISRFYLTRKTDRGNWRNLIQAKADFPPVYLGIIPLWALLFLFFIVSLHKIHISKSSCQLLHNMKMGTLAVIKADSVDCSWLGCLWTWLVWLRT